MPRVHPRSLRAGVQTRAENASVMMKWLKGFRLGSDCREAQQVQKRQSWSEGKEELHGWFDENTGQQESAIGAE